MKIHAGRLRAAADDLRILDSQLIRFASRRADAACGRCGRPLRADSLCDAMTSGRDGTHREGRMSVCECVCLCCVL